MESLRAELTTLEGHETEAATEIIMNHLTNQLFVESRLLRYPVLTDSIGQN